MMPTDGLKEKCYALHSQIYEKFNIVIWARSLTCNLDHYFLYEYVCKKL
jgi:hypothetical protein